MHKFLIHKHGDYVGVATQAIDAGEEVTGIYMDDNSTVKVISRGEVPLGHKIALVGLKQNEEVIEYGQVIGLTKEAWTTGDYVHTHNLKSKRWQ
ncbi:UxaA family hydrolase [Alicyclobacillus sp. SO9]|uniref:UxaA family hydrolase n=1 Tax=Alicyclobacillus sp. SO9 TaxID=2665646 RepID=UPI001E45166F|nr:UxaA family hydrolase [Alicyclobacillus sp. SO9]